MLADKTKYQLEEEVNYDGDNIGKCGEYNNKDNLEDACTDNPACVGYSTIKDRNTDAAADEKGFYPWCLKKTLGPKTDDARHNFYRKIREGIEIIS